MEFFNDDDFLFDDVKLDEIYNENILPDAVPENFTGKQKKYYKNGMNLIKSINEKYGCNFSFSKIINELDVFCINNLVEKKHENHVDKMVYEFERVSIGLAIEMERKKASYDLPEKQRLNNLKENYKEISKVFGLYVKLNPNVFPQNERKENSFFDNKGNLRSNPKISDVLKNNLPDISKELQNETSDVTNNYYTDPAKKIVDKNHLVDMVKNIIDGKEDSLTKLAKCVRLLRPLQASREQRSRFEYFTNHDVYVAERDTLRQCKEEMKRLGLVHKEISKVLHGKAFNNVKFTDGDTAREKNEEKYEQALSNREELRFSEEMKANAIERKKQANIVNEIKVEENVNNKVGIVIDELDESRNIISDNQIEENSNVKELKSNVL